MRIGLVAPPWVPVPPPQYGGTEVVVDNLARGLSQRGHDVTLFTIGESTCDVARKWLFREAATPMGFGIHETAHALAAYDALAGLDVIHDHTVLGPLVASLRSASLPPVVVTNHGEFDGPSRRIFTEAARHVEIVGISRAHARQAGATPIGAVVLHGIDLDLYRPGPGDGGYLLFLGRMSPDKGPARAIRIARRAGRPIVIAAKMRDAAEREYFETSVRPLLGPDVRIEFEPPLPEKIALLRGAAALLNPITWPEPFGLVMAEALACGTPIVSFSCGAAPEIVDDGVTGYLCADEDEAVRGVRKLALLDRTACRSVAEQRFSYTRMAGDYVRIYERARVKRARLGRPVRRQPGESHAVAPRDAAPLPVRTA
jgi:glycosyltransferase involved in cell wall biosynthesis